MKNIFEKFTNQYSLSKTLRFELKPVGKTQKMLEDAKVFEKDETIQKKYEQTKPYFDRLHREFVKESLGSAVLSNLSDYFDIFKKWKLDKKANEKELQNKEKELRKEVVKFFDVQAKVWAEKYAHAGAKKKDIELLFEEDIFAILKERYGSEKEAEIINEATGEIVSIFDSWKGFVGYFGKFFETRKNFYKDEAENGHGKAGQISTRVIDQNLKRFYDNIQIFEMIKEKLDFSEVEKNFEKTLAEVFSVDFYNKCFLQDGIDIYNTILGGETLENGEKKKGVNELINKYRQDHKGEKPPFLKTLDKQILSEKEKFIDEIENDEALLELLKTFQKTAEEKTEILRNIFGDFVKNNGKYDLFKIYISKEALNTISRKWTNETDIFEDALFETLKKAKIVSNSAKKKDGGYSFPEFIALSSLKEALEKIQSERFWKERYYKNLEDPANKGFLTGEEKIWEQFLAIFDFEFNSLFERTVRDDEGKETQIGYKLFSKDFETMIKKEPFAISPQAKVTIKEFADSVLTIYQMAKYFAVEKKRGWLTDYELDIFYTDPEKGYLMFYDNAYEEIVQTYNKLRNYLTKKPFSEEKWKLNFENPTLADGWDKNKESDNSAVILRKDGKYFLGLMSRGNNKIFDDRNKEKFSQNIEQGKYEKVVYKFTKDVVTGIPKSSTQVKEVVEHFKNSNEDFILEKTSSVGDFINPLRITREIFDLNNKIYSKSDISKSVYRWDLKNKDDEKEYVKSFQKDFLRLGGSPDFYKRSVKTWIEFCLDFLKSYPSCAYFDYSNLKVSDQYETVDQCYQEMNEAGYQISFQDISESYINEKNKNGELYLFEIHNKDWNEGAKGAKNLHTIYFESLFSRENIANNFQMKLNGQAEIFYRPKTKDLKKAEIITREKKQKINKDNHKGNKAYQKNRFTEDKIFFHAPLTFNRTKSDPFQFNVQINNFIANNPDINIVGVDRGEKHLAYYSVISQKQEILESGSLNEITGVNYADKLEEKAKSREQARKDWQTVEGIKDLKKGYISQLVRKLADLAINHNAIIVFEDLNMRFKQIRGGIEKSVYQQLEKALIEKLNFLVQKGETNPEKAGHLLRAYQLTAPFETFKDMGKQTGIIFYTQAAYTSRIDPITGWRPHLYLKYSSAEKAKTDISKFTKIEFVNGRFEFTYDIKNFQQAKEYPKNTVWAVCSSVERFRWDKSLNQNKGGYTHYKNLTENFRELFEKNNIDTQKDIAEQIKKIETAGNERFFKDFIFFFNLICQIRNTQKEKNGDENDFILSPVEPFFDSRKAEQFGKNLPKNGDDNGAYNIARKGIIILQKISKFSKENGRCEKMTWGDLYVYGTDWDTFAHKNQTT